MGNNRRRHEEKKKNKAEEKRHISKKSTFFRMNNKAMKRSHTKTRSGNENCNGPKSKSSEKCKKKDNTLLVLEEPSSQCVGKLIQEEGIGFSWQPGSFVAYNESIGRVYYSGFHLSNTNGEGVYSMGDTVKITTSTGTTNQETAQIVACFQATKSYYRKGKESPDEYTAEYVQERGYPYMEIRKVQPGPKKMVEKIPNWLQEKTLALKKDKSMYPPNETKPLHDWQLLMLESAATLQFALSDKLIRFDQSSTDNERSVMDVDIIEIDCKKEIPDSIEVLIIFDQSSTDNERSVMDVDIIEIEIPDSIEVGSIVYAEAESLSCIQTDDDETPRNKNIKRKQASSFRKQAPERSGSRKLKMFTGVSDECQKCIPMPLDRKIVFDDDNKQSGKALLKEIGSKVTDAVADEVGSYDDFDHNTRKMKSDYAKKSLKSDKKKLKGNKTTKSKVAASVSDDVPDVVKNSVYDVSKAEPLADTDAVISKISSTSKQIIQLRDSHGDVYKGMILQGNSTKGIAHVECTENRLKHTKVTGKTSGYEGAFENGYFEGEGYHLDATGCTFDGHFHKGASHGCGHGEMIYNDKSRYTGEWKNNWRKGPGKLTSVDGTMFEVTYSHDKRVDGLLINPDGSSHKSVKNNRSGNESLRIPDIIDMTFLSSSDDNEDDFESSSTSRYNLYTSQKTNKSLSKLKKSSERNMSQELDRKGADEKFNVCYILHSSDNTSDDDEDQEVVSDMTRNDARNKVGNSVSSFVDETDSIDPIYRIGEINEQNSACYKLEEFEEMWESALTDMGTTIHDLEEGSCVRKANNKVDTAVSSNQSRALYGRIFFKSTFKLFEEERNLHRKDVFVDIGHGIGNAPLLAAYTVGCESRGIEVIAERNLIADSLKTSIEALRNVHRSIHDRCASVGNVIFRLGRLEDPKNRDFLINIPASHKKTEDDYKGATKVLFNNYNSVFSDRSARPGQIVHLDDYVAALFALMVPGSVMITMHKLRMPEPRSVVDAYRLKQGLTTGDTNASFNEFEKNRSGMREIMFHGREGVARHFYIFTSILD